ncbi:hypothetical protein MBANPS3_001058 [Mucor bainieri]
MKRAWHSLPTEVWITVFDRLSEKKDLAQCRLVCKRWDPLAEKALFSPRLSLSYEYVNRKIHYHLSRKPFLGRYIQELHVMSLLGHKAITLVTKELLKLAITPEIKELEGRNVQAEFFEILLQIVQSSPVQFSKIECIPTPWRQFDLYLDLNYMFRNSIKSLEFNNTVETQRLGFFMNHLHEFTKVKKVMTRLKVSDLKKLDDILKQLRSLKYLEAGLYLDGPFIPKSKNELNAWLVQNVKQNENLEELQINRLRGQSYEGNLMDYLVYKYPNINRLVLARTTINLKFEHVLLAVKDVPSVFLSESHCLIAEDLWMLGYHLKSNKNIIDIRYDTYNTDGESCEIEINKFGGGVTEFTISLRPFMQHSFFKQLLSSVCTGQADITDLNIDLVHGKDPAKESEQLLTFYDILEWIPRIEKLYFSAEEIEYQEEIPNKLVLHELKALTLLGAKIGEGVITQIGELAPNLEELTLSSCLLLDDDDRYTNQMLISMPRTSLKELRISTYDHIFDNAEVINARPELKALVSIEDTINDENNSIYLNVDTPNAPEQYFLLSLYEDHIMLLSEEEFKKHSPSATVINIECMALSKITISLARTSVTLEWENEQLMPHDKVVLSENLRLREELSRLQQYIVSNGLSLPSDQQMMEIDNNI